MAYHSLYIFGGISGSYNASLICYLLRVITASLWVSEHLRTVSEHINMSSITIHEIDCLWTFGVSSGLTQIRPHSHRSDFFSKLLRTIIL